MSENRSTFALAIKERDLAQLVPLFAYIISSLLLSIFNPLSSFVERRTIV